MSTREQAMKVARAKSFATRRRWIVLGHVDPYGAWCYHAYFGSPWGERRLLPPRERG